MIYPLVLMYGRIPIIDLKLREIVVTEISFLQTERMDCPSLQVAVALGQPIPFDLDITFVQRELHT